MYRVLLSLHTHLCVKLHDVQIDNPVFEHAK